MKDKPLDWHPFAMRFPLLEGAEREAFKASIQETGGPEQPIVYRLVAGRKEGIDGRNREREALELGLEPKYRLVNLKDDQVIPYILRRNLLRRHLPEALRREIVSELRSEGHSVRQIATMTGVPRSTVQRDIDEAESTVPNGTVDSKDGRKRPASTRKLCDRCKRVGAARDCETCKALNARVSKQREPGDDTEAIRQDKRKPGKPIYDLKKAESAFGCCVREFHECKKHVKSEHWKPLLEALETVAKEWKELKKDVR